MNKILSYLCSASLALLSLGSQAVEPITAADDPLVVYKVESSFEEVKEFLELSITDGGMSISSVLHISEMLDRTAKDTGLEQKLYAKAESLEFCSVVMSYRMSLAHPANLANCPLTISLYTLPGDPDFTYVTYRRPAMLGSAAEAETALTELLDGIVRSAIE